MCLAEVSRDNSLNESYDDQGFGINTTHLKILHALKVLPDTTKILLNWFEFTTCDIYLTGIKLIHLEFRDLLLTLTHTSWGYYHCYRGKNTANGLFNFQCFVQLKKKLLKLNGSCVCSSPTQGNVHFCLSATDAKFCLLYKEMRGYFVVVKMVFQCFEDLYILHSLMHTIHLHR